eukprot:TRINITY_DN37133_c0_g1_i2.p1 TRINITY_DN37133_c0_g1~~TRINITY_DN37133_c0_g1_i2.p1  ORF type:complete len:252 (-),score=49.00 TRINITY_DN37133_c0_g1_i2:282-1037(-)
MEAMRAAAKCLLEYWHATPPKHNAELPTLSLHEAFAVPFATRANLAVDVADLQGSRMMLHHYLPTDVPRALWIDTDTIVRADLGRLYRMDMVATIAAQKKDYGASDRWSLESMAAIWDPDVASLFRDPEFHFFGTGLFVVDLEKWRAEADERTARLVKWSEQHPMGHGYDQVLMNIEFQDDVDVLDWRWNTDRLGVCAACVPAACIDKAYVLHWSGPSKPWKPKSGNTSRQYTKHNAFFEAYSPRVRCPVW